MAEDDSSQNKTEAQNEYFRAGFLAVFAAIAGFVQPSAGLSRSLVLIMISMIVLIGVGAYFLMLKPMERNIVLPQSKLRLKRMALLWYGLSIVLGVALVRAPAKALWQGRGAKIVAMEWLLCAVGISIAVVALWRLFKLIPKKM